MRKDSEHATKGMQTGYIRMIDLKLEDGCVCE